MRFYGLRVLYAALVVSSLLRNIEAETGSIRGIAHAAFRTREAEECDVFYERTLALGKLKPIAGTPTILFKVNEEQYVELVPGTDGSQGQLDHFALYTDNLAVLYDRLLAKKVPMMRDIHTGVVGNPFFTIRDPDGHPVEIVQYSPNSLTGQSIGKFMPPDRISSHISHVGILVRSESSALKFYRDTLGLREIARGSGDNGQPGWIDLRVPDGADYIELIPFADLPSSSVLKAQNHLGLAVTDVQKALAILQKRPTSGAQSIPRTMITGGNLPLRANIFDPDGARIELMEPLPAKLGGNGTPAHP